VTRVLAKSSATRLVGEATSDDFSAAGGIGRKVTAIESVCPVPKSIDIVFVSAFALFSVTDAAPAALPVALLADSVFVVPPTENATTVPGTAFPCASRTTAVNVVESRLSATGDSGDAVSSDLAAAGSPGVKFTVAGRLCTGVPKEAVTVLVSALVDASVTEAFPSVSVRSSVAERVFAIPSDPNWTVVPGTALPSSSRSVRASAEVETPSAASVSGVAVKDDAEATGRPGTKVTVAWAVCVPKAAVIVFTSALRERSVVAAIPEASVTAPGGANVCPVPVAENSTSSPDTGFP